MPLIQNVLKLLPAISNQFSLLTHVQPYIFGYYDMNLQYKNDQH